AVRDAGLRQSRKGDLLASLEAEIRGHAPVVNALVFERRVEVDGLDALQLAVADDDAALRALLWRPSDLGDHDIQLRTERAGEPAVGGDVLPVARAPGVAAQRRSVDLGC